MISKICVDIVFIGKFPDICVAELRNGFKLGQSNLNDRFFYSDFVLISKRTLNSIHLLRFIRQSVGIFNIFWSRSAHSIKKIVVIDSIFVCFCFKAYCYRWKRNCWNWCTCFIHTQNNAIFVFIPCIIHWNAVQYYGWSNCKSPPKSKL